MAWGRAGFALGAVAVGLLAFSGAHRDDAQTPVGLRGLPAPFLGTAVIGDGGRTAAVDAYGDVVDLRAPGPDGPPLVEVSSRRQVAGTVPVGSAIVARAKLGRGRLAPFWRADSVRQRYVPGTNVLRTVAWFGQQRRVVVQRAGGPKEVPADRRWLDRATPLRRAAPPWARAMYRRSLLVLRALTDQRSGAVVAGVRDAWAYVWPRDAAAVAIAFASAGYEAEARRVARFLMGLELKAAARFRGTGSPVPGRATQGDAAGWVAAAARAARLEMPRAAERGSPAAVGNRWRWHDRADYQEGDAGDYLGNAVASGADLRAFATGRGLIRVAGDPASGLDSAAAWAVRPFPRPRLYPNVRRTLLGLVAAHGTRFGIVPSQSWPGGDSPWMAPTAWTAWALATLATREHGQSARRDRRAALELMGDLRRAATPLGLLPERVDVHTGMPTSTTPLAWSHAFAILTLRELWPATRGRATRSGRRRCRAGSHSLLGCRLSDRARQGRRLQPLRRSRP